MALPRFAAGAAWTPLSVAARRTRMLARRVENEIASCMMIGTGLCCNLTKESGRRKRTRTRPWRTRGRRRGWRPTGARTAGFIPTRGGTREARALCSAAWVSIQHAVDYEWIAKRLRILDCPLDFCCCSPSHGLPNTLDNSLSIYSRLSHYHQAQTTAVLWSMSRRRREGAPGTLPQQCAAAHLCHYVHPGFSITSFWSFLLGNRMRSI